MANLDIWGKEWSPCNLCPRTNKNLCPSRSHRSLCDHAEKSKTFILSLSDEIRDPINRNVTSTKPEKKLEEKIDLKEELAKEQPIEKPTQEPTPQKINLIAIRELMNDCDYRGEKTEPCGCTKQWFCLAGKGRTNDLSDVGIVTHHDCWACVTDSRLARNIQGKPNEKAN